jgi:phosphopantetheinyl transferase (holo-ACP synthase)
MNKDLKLVVPETTALALSQESKNLLAHMPEHNEMLSIIEERLPEIQRVTSLFGKTQSQFMDNMLTVSHLTPLRNLRQILAEMNKTREAVKELHIKTLKQKNQLKIKERELAVEQDELKKELLQIEAFEIMTQLDSCTVALSGAIRKLTNYTTQYDSICEKHGIKDFTEEDFEKEEEKYHIMKAFDQAITAARSRNGIVDEGNMIYFSQIGINGAAAQTYIFQFLNEEASLIKQNKEPSHSMLLKFLENMANHFSGSAAQLAEYKGIKNLINKNALLKAGDTRLLLTKKDI